MFWFEQNLLMALATLGSLSLPHGLPADVREARHARDKMLMTFMLEVLVVAVWYVGDL